MISLDNLNLIRYFLFNFRIHQVLSQDAAKGLELVVLVEVVAAAGRRDQDCVVVEDMDLVAEQGTAAVIRQIVDQGTQGEAAIGFAQDVRGADVGLVELGGKEGHHVVAVGCIQEGIDR